MEQTTKKSTAKVQPKKIFANNNQGSRRQENKPQSAPKALSAKKQNLSSPQKLQNVQRPIQRKANQNPKEDENQNLKITFLGGIGEIGKNMTCFEYGKDMIVVDSGLSFPDDEMPGIDLVVQDLTYLEENKSKFR